MHNRYLLRNFSPLKQPSTTTSSLKVNKQTNRKKIFQECPEHSGQEMRQFCIWITLPETKQIKTLKKIFIKAAYEITLKTIAPILFK